MDRENVIKGLECCSSAGECGTQCPYWDDKGACRTHLEADALALLKEQEPHIVTIADYEDNPNVDEEGNLAVWRESRHWNGVAYHKDGWVILNKNRVEGWFNSDVIRFWTYKPTKAQMEAVKW